MTRVKIKVLSTGLAISGPLCHLQSKNHDVDGTEEEEEAADEEEEEEEEEEEDEEEEDYDETINKKKRKHGLRGTDFAGYAFYTADYCSDSAQGTSSSDEDEGEELKRDVRSSLTPLQRGVSYDERDEISGVHFHQRSGIRLKVKSWKPPPDGGGGGSGSDDSVGDRSWSNDLYKGMHYSKKKICIEAPPYYNAKSKEQGSNPYRRHEINMEELRSALTVVTKIMRMEAAEPFNFPVDPVALGIPDYFHVVKRPMDLGTICKNLERGAKYRNAGDVYKDVQLVWENCRSYNQKGDPILDLLARVKKNFTKYWTAAGLSTEKYQGPDEEEHSELERNLAATFGKHRRIAGTGHHKTDCACVVCAGVRRKLARDGKLGGLGTKPEAVFHSKPSIDGPGTAEEGKLHMVKTEIDSEPRGEFPNAMLYFRSAKEEASSDQIIGNEYVKDFDMGYSPDEDMEDIRYVCDNDEEHADEQIYRDLESSEGGVRYYCASYEMPLRTIHPSVLHLSQRLFGASSLWNAGYDSKSSLGNPILKTVSVLLRTKGAGC